MKTTTTTKRRTPKKAELLYIKADLAGKVVPITRCGFCGEGPSSGKVDLLVASKQGGAYICQDCVADALKTLLQNRPNYKTLVRRLLNRL